MYQCICATARTHTYEQGAEVPLYFHWPDNLYPFDYIRVVLTEESLTILRERSQFSLIDRRAFTYQA